MNCKLITACAVFFALCTAASAQPAISVNSEIGKVLASAKTGMTLYTLSKDAKNKSNCYDNCAQVWPPFAASASAKASGTLGIIERKDGIRQWALNGQPLYFWAGDAERGDTNGHGVGGVWNAARG